MILIYIMILGKINFKKDIKELKLHRDKTSMMFRIFTIILVLRQVNIINKQGILNPKVTHIAEDIPPRKVSIHEDM